jgi:catechol 2,3-dioxygenase-like lactoylglutathione lyase family enzyme
MDMKLEVVVIPMSDVERSKNFYGKLGWRPDADFVVSEAFRAVQFTPPGSPCSNHFGKGITSAAPGSALIGALRRADAAHGVYEERSGGQRDAEWPDCYARYMIAERAGTPLPS